MVRREGKAYQILWRKNSTATDAKGAKEKLKKLKWA
jgi:hypothetical protein